MQPRLKMRTLLTVCMITAGVVPLIIVSAVITYNASNAIRDSTYTQMNLEISSGRKAIQKYLGDVEKQNQTMANSSFVKDALQQFKSKLVKLPAELGTSNANAPELGKELERFYKGTISQQFMQSGTTMPDYDSLLPRNLAGQLAQKVYIADNPNPIGDKDRLNSAGNSSSYDNSHRHFHPVFRDHLMENGFYDVFLIEPDQGTIVYSVFKETDFATSLFNGPHRNSGLARVAREALNLRKGQTAIVDFSNYTPSFGNAASFIATPVYANGEVVGVIAYQLPIDKINETVAKSETMGDTGELFLLGEDRLMRSQSRFITEHTILRKSVETASVALALQGQSGTISEEVDGVKYLSAYAPLSIAGLNWVIMARIESAQALKPVITLIKLSALITALSVLAIALLAYFLGRHLHRQLGGDPSDLRNAAVAIGNGDLTGQPGDDGTFGAYASIVAMRNKLRSVLEESIHVADEVRKGANEISDANIGLSERTEQQAANLEQTASSTEEITSTVKQNAENTRNANQLAIQTRERAISTGAVAEQAVKAMREISASSERIADITSVIDEIAFQTNLLALNAAVEAARAGEQGRGFAVVATEVRQLAGRSASAAKEIKDLIVDSVTKVKDGTHLVQESGGELELIVTSVSSLTDIVGQISIASDEQAAGIDQINQALVHMDSVTQQNAAMVETAAATSRAMRDQAALLSSQISFFSSGDSQEPRPEYEKIDYKVPVSAQETQPVAPPANIARRSAANSGNHTEKLAPKRASGSEKFWDEF